jgi:acyl-CoA synthetase (AMP-forming)/AMP-acid ligase II
MPTLSALLHQSDEPAILLPPTATASGKTETISFTEFSAAVDDFRQQLDALGLLQEQDAVSMSLINSFEFVVAFIATGLHR